jgi:anaerobic ribonucleoside-triphosphate reductase activating protein
MSSNIVRVGRIEHDVTVLGPGRRSVIWVAGCPLACPGCITPELWAADSGRDMSVGELVDELTEHAVDGITWSGGEPFGQAAVLAEVTCHTLRRRPGLSVMAYSGFTRHNLERRADGASAALLAQLDLLVDGRYIRARHRPLRWRGSANQIVHDMSGRHAAELAAPDTPAGMHRHLTGDGDLRFTGVPPVAEFRERLAATLGHEPDASDHDGRPGT